MSRIAPIPQDDATVEEAARWFARLQDETATGEDWLALEHWLRASPANAAAYGRVEAVWAEVEELAPRLRAAFAPSPRRAPTRPGRQAMTRRVWLGAAAAAAAASVAGLLILSTKPQSPSPDAAATVYAAAPGETREIVLADGTRLRLNAGSRLTVRLDKDARRVVMADAEAAFDVAHDVTRPFLIQAGDRQVRVVGTEFNLRRRQGRVVLTVRRGLVEVRPAAETKAEPLRLHPGRQLTHSEATGRLVVTPVDAEEAFGWTEGRLICRDQPVSEIAADLGRRFGREIQVADGRTGETRFTGVLVLDEEVAVLDRLAALAPLEVLRSADGAVTLRRR